jgi:hypothetical protein
MAKRVDTTGIDAEFVINQAKPSNREKDLKPYDPSASASTPEPETVEETPQEEIVPPVAEPETVKEKETPKRKRGGQAGYKETFLKRNEIKTRQCVYISFDIHSVITKLVRALVDAGSDISVGGYIDTVLNEHLQLHKEEINEIYRQRPDDLL